MASSATIPPASLDQGIATLQDVSNLFYTRGWSVGTSSNYSILLNREPFQLLVTASGKDKRSLAKTDFVVIDRAGKILTETKEKSSAETGLHLMLAQDPNVGSVLHTHSVWGTLLSDYHGDAGGFWIQGYEMLKGLAGIGTHATREWVGIFPNSQDIPALAKEVQAKMHDERKPIRHGFLIRNHGLYTWGKDIHEARRHIEIFEFLFEVLVRRMSLR